MDVIQRLNSLRLERNMSVYRLAELAGVNQSTLANTFSRGTVPSISNLTAICEALGVTLAQFFAEDKAYAAGKRFLSLFLPKSHPCPPDRRFKLLRLKFQL